MLTSVHILSGVAMGKLIGNYYLTVPVSFLFHYFLDAIPHYNQKPVKNYLDGGVRGVNKKDLIIKSLEPIIGLTLSFYLVFGLNKDSILPMIFGGFFGWLPDLLVFFEWKYKINRPKIIKKFEDKYHRHTGFTKGITSQTIVILISIFYILK